MELSVVEEAGDVEAPEFEEARSFTVCGHCGACYACDLPGSVVRTGVKVDWRHVPFNELPAEIAQAAHGFRIKWLWKGRRVLVAQKFSQYLKLQALSMG